MISAEMFGLSHVLTQKQRVRKRQCLTGNRKAGNGVHEWRNTTESRRNNQKMNPSLLKSALNRTFK